MRTLPIPLTVDQCFWQFPNLRPRSYNLHHFEGPSISTLLFTWNPVFLLSSKRALNSQCDEYIVSTACRQYPNSFMSMPILHPPMITYSRSLGFHFPIRHSMSTYISRHSPRKNWTGLTYPHPFVCYATFACQKPQDGDSLSYHFYRRDFSFNSRLASNQCLKCLKCLLSLHPVLCHSFGH